MTGNPNPIRPAAESSGVRSVDGLRVGRAQRSRGQYRLREPGVVRATRQSESRTALLDLNLYEGDLHLLLAA
jgi:hypothetical protein